MLVFLLAFFCNGSSWIVPLESHVLHPPHPPPSHPPVITRPDEAVKQVAREFKMT